MLINVEKSILSTNFWPAPVKQSKNILSTKTFKVLEGKMYYFLSILSPVIYKSPSSLSLLFSVFMVICYVCMQYKHLPTSEPPFRSVIHWPEVQNVLGSLLIKCLYTSCNILACFVRPATCRQIYHFEKFLSTHLSYFQADVNAIFRKSKVWESFLKET